MLDKTSQLIAKISIDSNLSFAARSLLIHILHLNEPIIHTNLSRNNLVSEESITRLMNEICLKGYLSRKRIKLDNGKYGPYEYILEMPSQKEVL